MLNKLNIFSLLFFLNSCAGLQQVVNEVLTDDRPLTRSEIAFEEKIYGSIRSACFSRNFTVSIE